MALSPFSSPADFRQEIRVLEGQRDLLDQGMATATTRSEWEEVLVERNGVVEKLVDIRRLLQAGVAAQSALLEDLISAFGPEPTLADQQLLEHEAGVLDEVEDLLAGMTFPEVPPPPEIASEEPRPPGEVPSEEAAAPPAEPPPGMVVPVQPPEEPPPLELPVFVSSPISTVPVLPLEIREGGDLSLPDLLSRSFWESIFSDLAVISSSVVLDIPGLVRDAWGNLSDWADFSWRFMATIPDQVVGLVDPIVSNAANAVIGEVGGIVHAVMGGAEDVISEALGGIGKLGDLEFWGSLLEKAAAFLTRGLAGGANLFVELVEETASVLFRPLYDKIAPVFEELDPDLREIFDLSHPKGQAEIFIYASGLGALFGGVFGHAFGAFSSPMKWRANVLFRPRLLGQDEMATATYRFPFQKDEWAAEASRLGISDRRWKIFVDLQRPLPTVSQLRDAMFRGALTTPEVENLLTSHGYSADNRAAIFSTFPAYPQVQDVIRFGVRDVYRPEIVRDFQYDNDFPILGVPDAARVGIPVDEFRKYWWAHWILPSANQAFEMYHRTTTDPIGGFSEPLQLPDGTTVHRIISWNRLQELLRIVDIAPRWRDPLTRINWRLIPRRAIARLYRTGALTTVQVYRAYTDLGFTPENAAIQTDFVEKLEEEKTFDQLETILGGQAQAGALSVSQAMEKLSAFNVPVRVVQGAEIRIEARVTRDRLQDRVSAWRQALRFERVPEAAFRQEMAGLGILTGEIDHLVMTERVRAGLDFLPFQEAELRSSGRAAPRRRYREGISTENMLRAELEMLGYSGPQIDRQTILADIERDTELRLDTLGAYRAGLRTGRISEVDFRVRAAILGVLPDFIDLYVEHDQLRRRLEPPTDEDKELRATGRGTVLTRYREGWDRPDDFRAAMLSLGYTTAESDRYQVQADISFDLDWKADVLRALGEQFVRGEVEAGDYMRRLATLGMDPARAQTHLARLQATLLPRVRARPVVEPLPRYRTRSGKAELRLATEEFRSQIIDAGELADRLRALEMDDNLVEATVDIEEVLLERRLRQPDPPDRPEYQTDAGKVRTRTLRDAFRAGQLSPPAYQSALLELEVPTDLASAILDFETSRLAREIEEEGPASLPAYQTPTGRDQVAQIVADYRDRSLDRARLDALLRELEMPEELVLATADLEEFRLEHPLEVPEAPGGAFWQTDEGKIRVRTVRQLFRGDQLDADRLRASLEELEMPATVALAITEFELARRVRVG